MQSTHAVKLRVQSGPRSLRHEMHCTGGGVRVTESRKTDTRRQVGGWVLGRGEGEEEGRGRGGSERVCVSVI